MRIHRCWHYVPGKVRALKRIVHEASFIAVSLLRVLSLPRPDVFVVVSPPLLLGLAAWIAGIVKNSPFVFHVQDLQPDAAVGLGMLLPGEAILMMVIGGIIEAIWTKKNPKSAEEIITPLSSGFIAGEAIVAVIVPVLMVLGWLASD